MNAESQKALDTLNIRFSHTLPDVFAVTNRIVVMHWGR